MPTRKQRRRRAKEHRHEYVWEDAEGNELDDEDVPTRKAGARSGRSVSPRPAREAQAPSWRRTLKRGLVFAPIMFVTVMLLSSDQTLAEQLIQTGFIVAIAKLKAQDRTAPPARSAGALDKAVIARGLKERGVPSSTIRQVEAVIDHVMNAGA